MLSISSLILNTDKVSTDFLTKSEDIRSNGLYGTLNQTVVGNGMEALKKISKSVKVII